LCKTAWDRYLVEAAKVWSESKAVILPIMENGG